MSKKIKNVFSTLLMILISGSIWAQTAPSEGSSTSLTTAGLVSSGGTNSSASSGVEPDEFTGSVNYSIEILTPPARGSVKPTISLNYNSSRKSSNSWVGYGWELELGTIVRIPDENGLIDYFVGRNFEVRRGGQSETLKFLGVLGPASPYGQASDFGLIVPEGTVAEYYKAQIEGSFSHYIHFHGAYGTPTYFYDGGWVVIDKSGIKYEFGFESNGIEYPASPPLENIEISEGNYDYKIARWFLQRVNDPNGNTLNIFYNSDNYPESIRYQDITISFIKHNNMSDVGTGFFPAFREGFAKEQSSFHTLDRIDILKDSHPLQSFHFSYQPSSLRHVKLLNSIQQFDGSGTSLPPTHFNYFGENDVLFSPTYLKQAGHMLAGRIYDGRMGENATFADMNGDGLVDQVFANDDGSFEVYFSNGTEFVHRGEVSHWLDPFLRRVSGYVEDPPWRGRLNSNRGPHQWLFLIDMNGDALPDRVVRVLSRGPYGRDETANFLIAFNTGHGWADPITWRDPYIGEWAGSVDQYRGFVDMNGDGLVDRVISDRIENSSTISSRLYFDQGYFLVFYNTGAGFKTEPSRWRDPLTLRDPRTPERSLIYYGDNRGIGYSLRDFNGDGLPDRQYSSLNFEGDRNIGTGFSYFINNGNRWTLPLISVFSDGRRAFVVNGYTVVGMNDPIASLDRRGLISKENELIDVNGDGFLDRVEATESPCQIKLYFYQGLSSGASTVYSQFSTPIVLSDPIAEDTSRTGRSCGLVHNDDGGDNPKQFLFFQDFNGDGFPDRLAWRNDGMSSKYETHYLHVNAISFPSAPSFWDDKTVNQPSNLLKEIIDDAGGKMAMEYQPTARPRFASRPTHRFLPFNLNTIYKLYQEDYNFTPAIEDVSSTTHPGMRWTEYNFLGGNFYVRHAQNSRSENITAETLILKNSARFNGFQEVSKSSVVGLGETWSPTVTTTYYKQALGDIEIISADMSFFEIDGYGLWSLSGKPYLSILKEGARQIMRQETKWELSCPSLPDSSPGVRVESICFPKMTELNKSVYEAGGVTPRKSKVTFDYDEYGSITKENHLDDSGHSFLSLNTHYSPQSSFGVLKIRDRPEVQTKKDTSNNILRKKTFEYDSKGNPTKEHFFIDDSGAHQLTVERSFARNGNLEQLLDVDGVIKVFGYDTNALFPTRETLTTPSGTSLTTLRTYSRLGGEVSQELGPQNVGSRIERDGFGRAIREILIDQSGHETITKTTNYTYVDLNINDRLMHGLHIHQEMYQPGYVTPIQSDSYSDFAGNILQKCSQTERGNFRRIQYRIQNGGRTEIQTEPIFADNCNFVSTIDPMLRTFRTTKDLMGRSIVLNPPPGDVNSPIGSVTITYSNNSLGQLVKSTTNARGQVREETYDAQDRVIDVKDPLRNAVAYQYNAVGDLTQVSAGDHVLTTIAYDLIGRKREMSDADMGRWIYSYNLHGQLDRQIDARGHYVKFGYDTLGRTQFKEYYLSADHLEKREIYTYDIGESGYDVLPGELFQVNESDSSGNIIRRTRFDYHDNFRHQTKISRLISGVGEFHQNIDYDYLGRVTHTQYPGNKHLTYQYVSTGGLMKVCEGTDCTGEVYYSLNPRDAFDVFGSLKKETFGNGVVTDYQYYPASHRLQNKKVSLGTNQYFQRSYQYDEMSNVTDIDDPLHPTTTAGSFNGGLRSLTYDSLDRLSTYAFAGSARMERMDYDSKGNIQKNTASFGDELYQYTSSRPHAVTQIGARRFDYDANGNMISDPGRRMYYNAANQMTRVEMQNGSVVSYDYDYTGSRVKKRSEVRNLEGGTVRTDTHYLGDAIEIKGEQVIQHISAGSRRVATRTIGNLRDIAGSTAGGTLIDNGIDLDLNGTMILPYILMVMTLLLLASMRPIKSPSLQRRAGNPLLQRGRLISHFNKGGVGGILHLWKFWKSWTDLFQETLHRYPHHAFLKSFMLFMILLSQFQPMSLAFADEGRAPEVSSDRDYFYYEHDDHLGSSALMTEGKETARHSGLMYRRGDLLQRFEYAPFGKETYSLNPNLQIDPSYTGQKYDIETGLYFYKSRYYDPILGRFIQPDTIVPDAKNLQAYNRYTYVNNNPLKYVDPSGHFLGFLRKMFGAFFGGLIRALVTALLLPFIGPLAFPIGDLAGSVTEGAINGNGVKEGLRNFKNNIISAIKDAPFTFGNMMYPAIKQAYQMSLSIKKGNWEGLAIFASSSVGATTGAAIGSSIMGGGTSKGPKSSSDAELQVYPKARAPHFDFTENASPKNRLLLADGSDVMTDSMTDAFPDYGGDGVSFSGVNASQPIGGTLKISAVEQYFGPQTWLAWGAGGAAVGGISGALSGVGISVFGSGTIAIPMGAAGFIVGSTIGFKAGFFGASGIYNLYNNPTETLSNGLFSLDH